MERDIAFRTDKAPKGPARWVGRGSLTRRILAVNIVALALVAGSIFYLDGFRTRLIQERRIQEESELRIVAAALATAPPEARAAMLNAVAEKSADHLRLYDKAGHIVIDSWVIGTRNFRFVDPAKEDWQRHFARWIDALVDRVVVARIPPPFVDQGKAPASNWPELVDVMAGAEMSSRVHLAPDRTIVTSAATAVGSDQTLFLLSVQNPRDVTKLIREERLRLFFIVLAAFALSAALSLFLARTIVRPLRRLALAAMRVRLGRSRDVVVPRLPTRTDEIGILARSVSDMAQALRERIDETECFAADVTHELKNPLASLSSAVETLGRVNDEKLRAQLTAIIAQDVRRIDRLISDIGDMSRLDAQLTRAHFERLDLAKLVLALLDERAARTANGPAIIFSPPQNDLAEIYGDDRRIIRVIENLLDNAVSFSPQHGTILVSVSRDNDSIMLAVSDDGPGVSSASRDAIFDRFHSDRPEPYAFGQHSGLGLAIARTVVEGHNGTITVEDGESGKTGARFVVRFPSA